jgi:protein subunit release factor A
MSDIAGSNGAKREPTIEELEAELARLKQLQKDIQKIKEVEGFTDDRPFVEQAEERLKELKQLLAEQQGDSIKPSAEPEKPEEENE